MKLFFDRLRALLGLGCRRMRARLGLGLEPDRRAAAPVARSPLPESEAKLVDFARGVLDDVNSGRYSTGAQIGFGCALAHMVLQHFGAELVCAECPGFRFDDPEALHAHRRGAH